MADDSRSKHDPLDHYDELVSHLRPVEQLFQVMGAVGPRDDGAELVRGCAEIGTLLTTQLRASLMRIFQQDSGSGKETE